MQIPNYISNVLNILYSNGFEGYLVGGCVRDAMMGSVPHDFDLTTNATPDEMLRIFSGFRIIETGLKHGTVTVVSEGENVEITTYRIDGTYLDNRRPSDVTFTRNLEEDLSRRDFTVNALAYSPKDGLVDMFGGVDDLKAGVIRCVGNPDKRFGEDGLRIMRALRFSSVLKFLIDDATSKSIHSNKHLLKNISAERIYVELKKLVCGAGASDIIRDYSDVFEFLFPCIASKNEWFFKNAAIIDRVNPDHITRFSTLLSGYGDSVVSCFMNSLKPDNYSKDTVRILVAESANPLLTDPLSLRRLMSAYDDDVIMMLADVRRAKCPDFDYDAFVEAYTAQKLQNPCVRLSQLAVTGKDLISFGIDQGPRIGEAMQLILDAVMEERCENTYDAIKIFCEKLK